MNIDLDNLAVDASYLAGRFGLSAETLQGYMKRGLVRGTVEAGIGDDAGRTRLSVRFGNRMWIAIVSSNGSVLSEETRFVAKGPKGS